MSAVKWIKMEFHIYGNRMSEKMLGKNDEMEGAVNKKKYMSATKNGMRERYMYGGGEPVTKNAIKLST